MACHDRYMNLDDDSAGDLLWLSEFLDGRRFRLVHDDSDEAGGRKYLPLDLSPVSAMLVVSGFIS
ncbi:MAG: hypothetical protein V3T30_04435 [Thermodesulfobacteriota bacterium]